MGPFKGSGLMLVEDLTRPRAKLLKKTLESSRVQFAWTADGTRVPGNTVCWVGGGLTFVQRRRRWTIARPTFVRRVVSAGVSNVTTNPASTRRWAGAGLMVR